MYVCLQIKIKGWLASFQIPYNDLVRLFFVASIFTEIHKHNMWAYDLHIFTDHFTIENFQTKQPGGFCWRKTLGTIQKQATVFS